MRLTPHHLILILAVASSAAPIAAQTTATAANATSDLFSTLAFPASHFLGPVVTAPAVATPGAAATTPASTPATIPPALSPAGRLMVESGVDVIASPRQRDSTEGFERRITPGQVETSAGTFGDPSRYLQTLAGVTSDNDQRNDFLVRGGNPSENSFVIDNIEIPSINQLALSDTTGGFVSMLDENAIQQITLHTDSYDSRYDQRLSSIVDISTRPTGAVTRHVVEEVGMAGAGGSIASPWGSNGSVFFSARQGVMQFLTNDIGMNGVPHYQNAFFRAENRIDDKNNWWGMSLLGIDSILIRPSATDSAETNPFDIDYSGWRDTTGVNWQHLYSARSFGIASLGYADQSQSIRENGQMEEGAIVYNENSSDGIGTLKYDFTFEASKRITLTAGGRASLDQLNYAVAQPIGLENPYSEDPTPLDATAMARNFAPFSSAAYLQLDIALPHSAELVLGERGMQWALGGHTGATSKALLSMPILGKLAHVGYSEYEQLPPTLYLLSFNNLAALKPIHSRQFTGGVTLADNYHARITLEAYQKQYLDYPVAANYPQLSMANIADTFGQAFLIFPMVGQGRGIARGVELTAETRITSKLSVTAAMAYARDWYSGLDGVLRKGNFDLPLTANVTGLWKFGRGFDMSWRYATSSGKPYTPDNMALSYAQDRDVYDLTQVNAVRARAYSRLDFRVEQSLKVRGGAMTWHAGLQNAMGTKNFYCYQWMPDIAPGGQSEQDQMPRFPDGGVKYSF